MLIVGRGRVNFCVSSRFFVLGFKFPLDVGKKGQKKAKGMGQVAVD